MAKLIFSKASGQTDRLMQYRIGDVWCAVRNAAFALLPFAFALLALAPVTTEASDVRILGQDSYSYEGNTAVIGVGTVANFSPSGPPSGTLRLELWAFPAPWTSAGESGGYKLAEYTLGQLAPGFNFSNISSGPVPFTDPPDGLWVIVLFLTEYAAGPVDDGYTIDDYRNTLPTQVFGPPVLTPQVGLWWNPNESGSGYAFDFKHGVLVVTIYSYQPGGAPQWYLASGPLSGNTFTSTLDKYVGGQCISCMYSGRPTLTGNDGVVTITFSSSTSATMYLPDGRVTQIQPEAF
jgi:hypothetical protein